MKTAQIYHIRNTITGFRYIGATGEYDRRKTHHLCLLRLGKHSNIELQAAFTKDGEGAFEFLILATCPFKGRLAMEAFYIDLYDTFENGYNRIEDPAKPKFSDEILAARTKKILAGLSQPGVMAKRNAAIRAAFQRPEVKARFSLAGKLKWRNPKLRKKMLKAMHSPETKAKRAAQVVGEETREKMSQSQKVRCAKPGYRKIMAKRQRDWWAKNPITPEQSAIRSAGLRRRWSNPEARKAQGIAVSKAALARDQSKFQQVTYKGRQLSIAQLAREVEVNYKVLWDRIMVSKWPVELAVTLPKCARMTLKQRGLC